MSEDVRIIEGDALDVLPTLEGVGAVIADPPYGIAHETNRDNRQGTAAASWKGRQILGDDDDALSRFIIEWAEGRSLPWAVFGNWKCRRPPEARGILIWDKGPAFGMGDLSFPWKMSWEEIWVGGPGWSGKRDEGVLRGPAMVSWESKGRKHPHQKPVWLIRHLLSKLSRDLLILDPFAGSGTTPVACMKTGHPCIAVEKDARYLPIIRRRVAEASTPLFAETCGEPGL